MMRYQLLGPSGLRQRDRRVIPILGARKLEQFLIDLPSTAPYRYRGGRLVRRGVVSPDG
jgi:hypothetical protein